MSTGSSLRRAVWNERERRARTPVRLALAFVLIAAAVGGGVVVTSLLAALAGGLVPATAVAFVSTIGRAVPYVAFTGGILLAARVIDRRRLTDLGLKRSRAWWSDLAFGFALGVILPGVVFALELALGYLRVTGTLVARPAATLPIGTGVAAWLALALTLAYFVGVGVSEELLFRGYVLTNVAEGLDGWAGVDRRGALAAAVGLSSVGFGLTHSLNPNATALAMVVITLYGGFFAASYLLTGRTAIAIGMHVTWNFALSSVYGFPVSGLTTPVTVVAVEQSGPSLVTGGAFGPEGGLVALVGLVVGVGALVAWVRWREGRLRLREHVAVPDLRTEGAAGGEDPVDRTHADGAE